MYIFLYICISRALVCWLIIVCLLLCIYMFPNTHTRCLSSYICNSLLPHTQHSLSPRFSLSLSLSLALSIFLSLSFSLSLHIYISHTLSLLHTHSLFYKHTWTENAVLTNQTRSKLVVRVAERRWLLVMTHMFGKLNTACAQPWPSPLSPRHAGRSRCYLRWWTNTVCRSSMCKTACSRRFRSSSSTLARWAKIMCMLSRRCWRMR